MRYPKVGTVIISCVRLDLWTRLFMDAFIYGRVSMLQNHEQDHSCRSNYRCGLKMPNSEFGGPKVP